MAISVSGFRGARLGGWGKARLLFALAFTLALVFTPTPQASAAETGTLRGNVLDQETGEPLSGVIITLTGSNLPGARTKQTDVRGTFWFPVLPPGSYQVNFSLEGYQTLELPAVVELDRTETLSDVRLSVFEYSMDVIEVIETLPTLDTTSSATVTNVDTEYFERLPVGRNYTGTIRTLPGVSGRIDYSDGSPSYGEPSVRGEGLEGNNYLLEGFSIRDPVDKGFAIAIPNEAIQELTVFTDGAPAEYGTFTGMVANILLKSGENQTHGSLQYLLSRTLTADASYMLYNPSASVTEDVTKRHFANHNGIFTLGGAVVPDKLWYFTSATLSRGYSVPDGSEIRQELPYNYQLAGRLTYNPFEVGSTLFNVTILSQEFKRSNFISDIGTAPEAQLDGTSEALNLNVNMKTLLSDLVIFEAKYNRWTTEFHSVPVSGDYITPSYSNVDTLTTYNNAAAAFHETRARNGVALHLTRYVIDRWGDHVIKGGFEWLKGNNVSERVNTGGAGVQGDPALSYQVQGPNNEPYTQTESYNVGPLNHGSTVNVFFLQDQWQPFTDLTLNLGSRLDHEVLTQVDGRSLVDAWVFSPRFGLAWDLLGDGANLLSANAGRYHDISSLGLAIWGDTRSADYFRVCPYDPDTGTYADSEAECLEQDPVAEPSVFTPDFRPYGVDKFTLGLERALPGNLSVGVKGVWSRTFNLSEDVNVNDSYWEIRNPTTPKTRDYKGLELTAKRRWRDNWQLLASYTLSAARGTTPGQTEGGSAGNDVGVYLDNPSDPYVRDYYDYLGPMLGFDIYNGLGYDAYSGYGSTWAGNDQGFYGYLPYHSFHQLKVNGSYEAPFGTRFGLVYELDSGHAWERNGFLLFYGNSTFPEGRGVRMMPPIHYIDVSVGHSFALPKDRQVDLQLEIYNVFDLEQPISYFNNFSQAGDYCQDLDGANQYALCPQYGMSDEDAAAYQANPGFGEPFYRQGPRSIQASARFSF